MLSSAFLLAVGLTVAAAPAQAEPWISSPSGAYEGTVTEVFGGGFPLGEQVVLEIADPSDSATLQVVQVDEQGNISLQLPLNQAGQYVVKAWSSGGPVSGQAPLAEAIVSALQ
jgi:hypothetical protein